MLHDAAETQLGWLTAGNRGGHRRLAGVGAAPIWLECPSYLPKRVDYAARGVAPFRIGTPRLGRAELIDSSSGRLDRPTSSFGRMKRAISRCPGASVWQSRVGQLRVGMPGMGLSTGLGVWTASIIGCV